MIHYTDDTVTLHHGDALEVACGLESGSVRTIVTSPPYYGLRDYGEDGQIGTEASVGEYVDRMVELFRELRRLLSDDGTLWLNLGDSYAASEGQRKVTDAAGPKQLTKRGSTSTPSRFIPGLRPKNLIGVPWRVAFALQADGWILRSDIIWAKPNPMPESVTDRPTKAHEYLFLFAKSSRYYYDAEAIAEKVAASSVARLSQNVEAQIGTTRANGGSKTNGNLKAAGGMELRNKRTVWEVTTQPFSAAHFAVYPPELIRPCILADSEIENFVAACRGEAESIAPASHGVEIQQILDGIYRSAALGAEVRLD